MADGPAWLAIACPRCEAPPGEPCWRTYPVRNDTMKAADVPILGYCTDRAVAAREAAAG